MWLVVLCILFRVVASVNGDESKSISPNHPLLEIKHCYKSGICPPITVQTSDNYTFHEGLDVTVTCTSTLAPLQWVVPTYPQLISDKMDKEMVFFNIEKLDRNDDHLKIKCKNNNGEAEIIFLWNKIPTQNEYIIASRDLLNFNVSEIGRSHDNEQTFSRYERRQFIEGEVFPKNFSESCIIKKQNSTAAEQGNNKIENIRVEHNQSTLLCAKFDTNILKLDKYFVTVETKPMDSRTDETQHDNNALYTEKKSLYKNEKEEESTPNDSSDTHTILQIVGGSIALLLLLVSLFLAYKFNKKRRRRLNENIYSEPQAVAYAEITCNGPGVFLAPKNEPYAQIIGVLKKKTNNKPSSPPLPPPRNKTSIETDERDTKNNKRDMDNNQTEKYNRNGENNYSEIQHQNY